MGWRADDAYERKRDDDYRQWLASLTWQDRLRVRAGQAFRLSLLITICAAFIYAAARS